MPQIILTGLFLGIGLAMDAFAVSISDGLKEDKMKTGKCIFIAFIFAVFQLGMPLIGYFVGHVFVEYIEKFIPYIALALLAFLGIKMIIEFIKNQNKPEEEIVHQKIGLKIILVQAVATSIDALSTGLTFANYNVFEAIICVLLIGIVTFGICLAGVYIGKKSKTLFAKYADLIGGIILLLIGIEIFVTGLIGL